MNSLFSAPLRLRGEICSFRSRHATGFTLIELLFVLLIVALLASLVAPVVTSSIQRARESTLREDLHVMRKAIDDYYADTGKYPAELEDLVKKRYLRKVPIDPVTESRDTWALVRSEDSKTGAAQGIIDVHSGSDEKASDETYYKDW